MFFWRMVILPYIWLTRTTFGDRVFAPAGPRVKKVFPTDWCALHMTMVEKTEPWTSAVCRPIADGDIVKLLSWTRHSLSLVVCLVCRPKHHSNPCQWKAVMMTNRITEWLLNSFALCVNFDDINCWCWSWTHLFYT